MTDHQLTSSTFARTAEATRPGLTLPSVAVFFALTSAIGWGAGIFSVLYPAQMTALFGEIGYTNPLFVLMVYSPAIAGILIVWRHYGLRRLGSFQRRLTLWRMPAAWWLVLLLMGIPASFYLGAAIKGTLADPFPFSPWFTVLPALAIRLVIGPIEEFGWRGVALPLLQRRFAPLWAGLILGAIWGLRHVPAFFLSGTPQSAWLLGPFFVGVLTISVILTPMFNAARSSLLVATLFHFQLNGPAWPDAQPWDTLVFAVVAVVVVLLNRRTMFTRAGAITEVLMPEQAAPGEQPAPGGPGATAPAR